VRQPDPGAPRRSLAAQSLEWIEARRAGATANSTAVAIAVSGAATSAHQGGVNGAPVLHRPPDKHLDLGYYDRALKRARRQVMR
jgi:hypothetical protein